MKVLWAPWRMEYVRGLKGKDCIFCLGLSGGDELTLHKGSLCMVMMNRYPYCNGHLLVAPRRHVGTLSDLTRDEMADMMETITRSVEILKQIMKPDGFNLGLNLGEVAGAGIAQHLHFHVVPRWQGDANFMTVLGDVRVISEDLSATYGRLRPFFDALVAHET